jgi:hypothetical protein
MRIPNTFSKKLQNGPKILAKMARKSILRTSVRNKDSDREDPKC